MDELPTSTSEDSGLQRLAAKSSYAADFLCDIIKSAHDVQKLEKKVNGYIQQVKLILTWKRGCGSFQMVGSAAKTLGGVMVVAAPLHPKLGVVVKVGSKLWKFGTGLKILSCIGEMLKDVWQTGCRNSLTEFVHAATRLTRNLNVFGEVIQDLQGCARTVNNSNRGQTPAEITRLLKQFIPSHQLSYIVHVINIAFGSSNYSPLFDFMVMSADLTNDSSFIRLMRDVESFHFAEFVERSDVKSLIIIGSFLHISRELLDFLDGFRKVTDHDCQFLMECLTKFSEQSLNIMKAVVVLTNLDQIRRQQLDTAPNSSAISQ